MRKVNKHYLERIIYLIHAQPRGVYDYLLLDDYEEGLLTPMQFITAIEFLWQTSNKEVNE